jgi:hypothetical protein
MSYTSSPNFLTGVAQVFPVIIGAQLADMSAVSINSIATVATPATGKKLQLIGGTFSLSADASVLFEDNTAATANFVFRSPLLAAKTPYTFWSGKTLSAADNVLKATASASAAITGVLWFANV